MGAFKVIIKSGDSERTVEFQLGIPLHRILTLVIEPVRSASFARDLDDLRPLPSGLLPLSQLVDNGDVEIKLLDQDSQVLGVEQELLEQLLLVPSDDQSISIRVLHGVEESVQRLVDGQNMQREENSAVRDNRKNRTSGVRIRVWKSALEKARKHARAHTDHEVGGMCMGIVHRNAGEHTILVEVTDTFQAEHTINRGASITFTPDTWSAATRVIDREYADSEEFMVGWYHTHPSYGIFLSSVDLFTHKHFFNEPWHLALVIDPVRDDYGFFVWDSVSKDVARLPNSCIELVDGSYRNQWSAKESSSTGEAEVNSPQASVVDVEDRELQATSRVTSPRAETTSRNVQGPAAEQSKLDQASPTDQAQPSTATSPSLDSKAAQIEPAASEPSADKHDAEAPQ